MFTVWRIWIDGEMVVRGLRLRRELVQRWAFFEALKAKAHYSGVKRRNQSRALRFYVMGQYGRVFKGLQSCQGRRFGNKIRKSLC